MLLAIFLQREVPQLDADGNIVCLAGQPVQQTEPVEETMEDVLMADKRNEEAALASAPTVAESQGSAPFFRVARRSAPPLIPAQGPYSPQ